MSLAVSVPVCPHCRSNRRFACQVNGKIVSQLEALRDEPNIEIRPLIYHLDVGVVHLTVRSVGRPR